MIHTFEARQQNLLHLPVLPDASQLVHEEMAETVASVVFNYLQLIAIIKLSNELLR